MSNLKKQIEQLIEKAARTDKSEDAMRFSQAALNAANAALGLNDIERKKVD